MLENTPRKDRKYVGKDVPRIDSVEKLTGQALYTADLEFAGMLHGKVLRSPHAKARIVMIDTSKASRLTGVHAVLTGKDLDYRVGLYLVDKYILARDTIRHFGEAIAAVAAETPAIAQQAIDLIEIEYEVMTPFLDPKQVFDKKSPLVHPDLGKYDYIEAVFTPVPGTNIANHTKLRKGDVKKGFKNADYIFEREYTNPNVQHVPMETHIAVGKWDVGDRITIHTSAQSPFTVRNLFAHSFKIPHCNIRVITPYLGGGFGGKAGIHLEPLCCCLSKVAGGRPVRIQATREEEFSLLPCRSGLVYNIKTGVKKNGKIVAQKMTMYWDAGAYADYAVNVTRASGFSASGPYEIENAWVDAYTVYTNKPFGTAYRGFGHVEFSWGVERHMNFVAEQIGIDPLTFRRLNALKPGSKTMTGEEVTKSTGNVTKCMDAVAKSINYGQLTDAEIAREKRTGRKIGKSVVALHKAPAMPPFTGTVMILKLNEDASVTGSHSLTDYGMGTYTSLAQIIAEVLRFPMERIRLPIENDTDRDPYDWQTVASKGLLLSGNAAILAAQDLLDKCYDVAAQVLRAQKCDLDHDADRVFVKHHTKSFVTFKQMAVGYAYPDGNAICGPIVGIGRYIAQGLSNLNKETGQGSPALDWTYGAHGLIVEVDPKTGEYNLIKVASAYDVGCVINEASVRGQAIGGMLQGLGTAMCEGYIYNDKGQLLNPSFTDNKIPTSLDIPEEIDCIAIETPQIDGPFGARGVGEHSMIAVCGALGNAIEQAVGAVLTHMPIRQEDVWRAMRNKKSTGKAKPRKVGRSPKADKAVKSAKPAKTGKVGRPSNAEKAARASANDEVANAAKPKKRGRPSNAAKAVEAAMPKKLGRPPKSSKTAEVVIPKKLGRPPKADKAIKLVKKGKVGRPSNAEKAAKAVQAVDTVQPKKRGRPSNAAKAAEVAMPKKLGRPPKADKAIKPAKKGKVGRPSNAEKAAKVAQAVETVQPKKRGRPSNAAKAAEVVMPKKLGRPPKADKAIKPAKKGKVGRPSNAEKAVKVARSVETVQPKKRGRP
ncbi:MAG: molybdopterin-dependent oxidoreductase, partial [Candidatus Riflebacteria bacterium]|nr:molybdopterin-dependent oxidoreductase [Candidatus Riflebacteria bacterium]